MSDSAVSLPAKPKRGRAQKSRPRTSIVLALLAFSCAAIVYAASEKTRKQTPDRRRAVAAFDASQLPFERLDFRAKKLFLSADASIAAEMLPRKAANGDLLEGKGGFSARGPTLRLDVGSGFMGRESLSQVWLEPGTARALQRVQLETGKRRRYKTYRFAPEAVFATRANPGKDQPGEQNPAVWTKRSETRYDIEGEGLVVTEPSALFLILTTAPAGWLDEPRVIHTFTSNELHRVEIAHAGASKVRVDYEVEGSGQATKIRGTRPAQVYALRPLPRADGSAGEVELLGLEGEIELFLDADTRLPLQISGRVPPLGQVHVRLKSATLPRGR